MCARGFIKVKDRMSSALDDFAQRALDWIDRHRNAFRLVGEGQERLLRIKRLAELGLVATAASERSLLAADLADFAWQELGRGAEIGDTLYQTPALAVAYLPFRLTGRRSAELEARLAAAEWRADWRQWPGFVRYANGCVLESIGVPIPWSQSAEQAGLEMFTTQVSQRFAVQAEVSAHVVLWRTHFGRYPAALSPDELASLGLWVSTAVATLTAHGLLDPLAEVLAANASADGSSHDDAWQPLFDAQRRDGAVPVRVGENSESFVDLYHSTLAATLAASLCATTKEMRRWFDVRV